MKNNEIKRITFGDMDAVYIISDDGNVAFGMLPADCKNFNFNKGKIDSLVQISCTGDSSVAGFAAGETRHNSGLTMSLKYLSQSISNEADVTRVITVLENPEGIHVEHVVVGKSNCRSLCVYSQVLNKTNEDLCIEALSSFSLSGITPFADDKALNRLLLHRFRSRWSAEGRHEIRTIEELLLEPSWSNFSVRLEKFGAIGSMPIRGYFPFLAIEDKDEGVFWGITNACSSSWQIEAVRIDENLCISGGLADYEYGHWRKTIKPGEYFATPMAYLTVVKGDFACVCDRMLDVQKANLLTNQKKNSLPSIFNEYCTTWGEPSEAIIEKILTVINGENFDYFVIDAGWYADSIKGWQDNMGDWLVASDLFPNGLKTVVDKIKKAGMKAGIWFELEVVGKDSDAVNDTAHLLTRDGKVIISGTRRFWDMRSKWVDEYLTHKVIDFLNDNGFEYIKIDYNETIGIGCDGADSVGEGLRQCVEATKHFYSKIRECVPGIAIEVCSSGGHRLEPSFMQLADYLSFSDAHEEKEIPVIAADLHNLILPSKSQIWAVLRKTDKLERIAYSICAGMYGVLCISGDVFDLSKEQWLLTKEGVNFYKEASGVIANGLTKRFGPFQNSNRDLRDYQASVRYGEDGRALIIVHSYEHVGEQIISIPLDGDYEIVNQYETGDHEIRLINQQITVKFINTFDALAILLQSK